MSRLDSMLDLVSMELLIVGELLFVLYFSGLGLSKHRYSVLSLTTALQSHC